MSDTETRILREVLATMAAEAPAPFDFENLADIKVKPEPIHVRVSPWVAFATGFAVIVVTLGGFALTRPTTPESSAVSPSSDSTIFMMPEFVPDDLVLVRAEAVQKGTLTLTQQIYHQEGLAFSEAGNRQGGESIVEIHIVDRTDQVNDPETDKSTLFDLSEYATALRESNPELVISEALVRGRPALVIEGLESGYEATNIVITVLIDEGKNTATELTSEQLTRDTVVAIAESLTPTSPSAFKSSNWRYQDISNAALVWVNQLGLNQTDEEVWGDRLDIICAPEPDLFRLAKQYIGEDAEYSVRSDGTLPTPEETELSLGTIRRQTCER